MLEASALDDCEGDEVGRHGDGDWVGGGDVIGWFFGVLEMGVVDSEGGR